MQKTRRCRILFGIAVFAWMGVIFYFSSQTGEESSLVSGSITDRLIHWIWRDFDQMAKQQQAHLLGQLTFFVRKCAHFTEYAVLGGLVSGFLDAWNIRMGRCIPLAWLWGILYACSDELHQMFTDGRSPKGFDVLVDSAGVLAGICIAWVCIWLMGHYRRSKGQAAALPKAEEA